MKTIIFILFSFVTISARSQQLDTVYVRNLTMQAQDWAWLVGKYPNKQADSSTAKAFRKIRTVIQSNIPPTWTTTVTIDSLPGFIVVAFYQQAKTANAGEIVTRYAGITNAISAKANVSYWVGYIDAAVAGDFDRARNLGKNFLIDL